MLHRVEHLRGYHVLTGSGTIGHVRDFYFGEEDWDVRYLVVVTGRILPGRVVFISPIVLQQPDPRTRTLTIELSIGELRSRVAGSQRMLSCHQLQLQHYGACAAPDFGSRAVVSEAAPLPEESPEEPNLRGTRDVLGRHIWGQDGILTRLEDLLVDDESWIVRYLVAGGDGQGKFLLSPKWLEAADWLEGKLYVPFSRETVLRSPSFDPARPVTRSYEESLFNHYSRLKYWI
jgi:hypothetical protein